MCDLNQALVAEHESVKLSSHRAFFCPEKPLCIFFGPDKMLVGATESPELLLLLGLGFFYR